jgi:hypothetical protein
VEEDGKLHDSKIKLLNLRHYAFSLLQKADPASFVFSRLEAEHRSPVLDVIPIHGQ